MLIERENLKKEVKRGMSRLVAESLNDIELVLGVLEAIIDSDLINEDSKRKLNKLEDVYQKIRTKIMYVNSNEMKRIDDYIDGLEVEKRDWQIIYFDEKN